MPPDARGPEVGGVRRRIGDIFRNEYSWLGLLLVVAFLARTVALGSFPANMMADEADNLRFIYLILIRGQPPFLGYDWTQAPAFNLYLMTPLVWLGGLGLGGLRLTTALLTTVALIPFYLIARRAMSPAAALASVALLATSLWYLNFSRSGWYNADVCLYLLAFIWLLQKAFEANRMRWYLAAGVVLSLCLYGYFAGRAVPVALLAVLPVAVILYRGRRRSVLVGLGLTILVAAVMFAPQVLLGGDPLQGRFSSVAITNAPLPYLGETSLGGILAKQAQRTFSAFVLLQSYSGEGLNSRFIPPGWSYLDPVTSGLYLVGLLIAALRWRTTWLWWPMLLIPLFATQVFSIGTPDGSRAIMVAPLMILFAGLTLDQVLGAARPSPHRLVGLTLLVGAIAAWNIGSYVQWQSSSQAAEARQPAVKLDEFDAWREAVRSAIATRRGAGFNVGEWKEMQASSGSAGALDHDATRRSDLEAIVTALAGYRRANGHYPSTNDNFQTACAYEQLDVLCGLNLAAGSLIDPLGEPLANGYWYVSDGASYTVYARLESSPDSQSSCPAPPELAHLTNLVCREGR